MHVARVRIALSYGLAMALSFGLAAVFPLAVMMRMGHADTARANPVPRSGARKPSNRPPSVTAGPTLRIVVGEPVALEGAIRDDGLPGRARPVAAGWSLLRGPRAAAFADPSSPRTRATFSVPGLYALRLAADDGELLAIDDVLVEVTDPNRPAMTRRVASGGGAGGPWGPVRRHRDRLELVGEGGDRITALRFTGLAIPRNAKVLSAHVQFVAAEEKTWTGALTIRGQDVDDAPALTKGARDAGPGPLTIAGVDWSPVAWTGGGGVAAGRTPDLGAVIQEIVCRAGWTPGNALVLVLRGAGEAPREPVGGARVEQPLLQVEYRSRSEV